MRSYVYGTQYVRITYACETLAVMYLQRGPPTAENKTTTHRTHRTHRTLAMYVFYLMYTHSDIHSCSLITHVQAKLLGECFGGLNHRNTVDQGTKAKACALLRMEGRAVGQQMD